MCGNAFCHVPKYMAWRYTPSDFYSFFKWPNRRPKVNLPYKCPMAIKFGLKKAWPERRALLGSKVMQGSSYSEQKVNLNRNFRPTATQFQEKSITRVQHMVGSKVIQDQAGIPLICNALTGHQISSDWKKHWSKRSHSSHDHHGSIRGLL